MTENNISELDKRRKKIAYRSWYRGCKETDKILGNYARENIDNLSNEDLDLFEVILELDDKDIYNWLSGKEEAPAEIKQNIIYQQLEAFTYR